jgi:hypothetical protein
LAVVNSDYEPSSLLDHPVIDELDEIVGSPSGDFICDRLFV